MFEEEIVKKWSGETFLEIANLVAASARDGFELREEFRNAVLVGDGAIVVDSGEAVDGEVFPLFGPVRANRDGVAEVVLEGVAVANPNISDFLHEGDPFVFGDFRGGENFDGAGAVFVAVLGSHDDVGAAHDAHFESDAQGVLLVDVAVFVDEGDDVPPSLAGNRPVRKAMAVIRNGNL